MENQNSCEGCPGSCGGCQQQCGGCPGSCEGCPQQCGGCPGSCEGCPQQCGGCPGSCEGCPQQCGGCPGSCEGCPQQQQCGGCPGSCGGCPGSCEGCPQQQQCGGCPGSCCGNNQCAEEEEQEEQGGCHDCCCHDCHEENESGYKTYGVDSDGYELLTEDGGVKKKIIKQGTGKLPEANSKATVHYDGYLYPTGEEFDSSRKRQSPFTFTLDKGEVIKAWDIGISTIRKGEKATLICAPEYAYGENGSPPTIGKNATLRFEVEALNYEPPHQTISERIQTATESKEEGNKLFKEKKFEEAISTYNAGLQSISYTWGANPIELKNIDTLKVLLNSNLAMCYLKTNSLNDVVKCCKEALELDEYNTKVLYRLSEAYIGLSNFSEANEVINKCLEINPDDALFKRQALISKKKEKEFKSTEKKMYSRMFS